VVAHAYNSSTWEEEVGGTHAQGQPGLHSETLSQQTKGKTVKVLFVHFMEKLSLRTEEKSLSRSAFLP
jgi:hypothetical protein